MPSSNWLQILIVVVIFGGGFLKWLLERLQKQAIARRAEQERIRREHEALRTGRVGGAAGPGDPFSAGAGRAPAGVGPATDERLRAIAEARARKLEELRRARGAASGAPRPAPVPEPQSVTIRLPPGIVVTIPTGESAPASPPARAEPDRPRPARAKRSRARREAAPAHSPAADTSWESSEGSRASPKPAATDPVYERAQRRAALAGVALSVGDLRRAVVLREVLGPPLAAREASEAGPGAVPQA